MYVVTARLEKLGNGVWGHGETKELPTFFLDENVLGITDQKHASKFAHSIIDPFGDMNIRVFLHIEKV